MRTPLSENTIINNRYVVQKTINSKNINQINYQCVDQTNGQIVLVKEFFPIYAVRTETGDLEYSRLPDDSRDKFIFSNKNAQLYGKLPTIFPVVDLFVANNTTYAVCEYCKGKTIRKLVDEGSRFSKTTVQNTIIMLLKTNMVLAKFGLCNRNFHPDNVFVTEDGYIKLMEFCPGELDTYEGESTKSIAALGFFMMTGRDTELASRVRKHASTPREQQLIDYMLYVIDESSTVSSKAFYNAALLRFDKRAGLSSDTFVETETNHKVFEIFSRKRFAAFASIIAIVVVVLSALVAFQIHKDLKKKTDLGFETLICITDLGKDELKKSDFASAKEDLFTNKYEYTFENTNMTSKEMKIELSLKNPETTEIQWEYNGKKQKKSKNKKEITVKPSDNNREIILTLNKGIYGIRKEIYTIKLTSIKDFVVYTHKTKEDKGVKLADFDFTAVADGGSVSLVADVSYVSFEADTENEDYTISIECDGKKIEPKELVSLDSGPARITVGVYKDGKITETRIYCFEVEKVTVPDVSGKDVKTAEEELKKMGFKVKEVYEYNPNVDSGYIISQNPKKEMQVEYGFEVTVVVSKGENTTKKSNDEKMQNPDNKEKQKSITENEQKPTEDKTTLDTVVVSSATDIAQKKTDDKTNSDLSNENLDKHKNADSEERKIAQQKVDNLKNIISAKETELNTADENKIQLLTQELNQLKEQLETAEKELVKYMQ